MVIGIVIHCTQEKADFEKDDLTYILQKMARKTDLKN